MVIVHYYYFYILELGFSYELGDGGVSSELTCYINAEIWSLFTPLALHCTALVSASQWTEEKSHLWSSTTRTTRRTCPTSLTMKTCPACIRTRTMTWMMTRMRTTKMMTRYLQVSGGGCEEIVPQKGWCALETGLPLSVLVFGEDSSCWQVW